MKTIQVRQGLDIPVDGVPEQRIVSDSSVSYVALVGDDYPGLKPTMLVRVGDRVALGEALFRDKKSEGFNFTAPGSGTVAAVNRGAKRKFESLVIELDGDERIQFDTLKGRPVEECTSEEIRSTLQESGLWTSFRARPFGTIPAVDAKPSSLFITALDTNPLAADPQIIIAEYAEFFKHGLAILRQMLSVPLHLCVQSGAEVPGQDQDGVEMWAFSGPHPAGLPSTHIHFIDPVYEEKQVWHIGYQDVIAIGYLLLTGELFTERIIALGGPGIKEPLLLRTRAGANLDEILRGRLDQSSANRVISGSILDGRALKEQTEYLGRYHCQVSVIREGAGRGFLSWLAPGGNRFSATGLFLSSYKKHLRIPFLTAAWGGERAIFPLGTYENVMPLDIIATALLKSLAVGDTETSVALGCLELVEEDLALCSFVCPGKNEFGPMLRDILTTIEKEG